jgi:sialic acid synthase SpsE
MRLEIAGRRVGPGEPVFVVAEIGLNHGGCRDRALALVDAAAAAGASAIKLQSLEAATLVAAHCPAPAHVTATSLREFFQAFELDADAHRAVVQRARERGLAVLSTPFSEAVVPMLESLQLDAYKIASGDLTYDGLITRVAKTGRPMILSSGMSDLTEVHRALRIAREAGATDLAVLHCVSSYPTPPNAENLRAIVTLAKATGVPVGLSDHGSGLVSAIGAAALGACIYERHFVAGEDDDAIDRAVSSTPAELAAIVQAMEQTRAALGDGVKRCQPVERANVVPSRRGLYAFRELQPGEVIRPTDVAVLRPASDLAPSDMPALIGAKVTRTITAGAPFVSGDLAKAGAA